MPIVWPAEVHLVLGQSEHGSGLAWEFLLMQCSVGMSPCRMALALGYCPFIWAKSHFGGTQVSETGDFTQGPLWFHKWKEEPFHLERQPCGEWCTAQRSRAECCSFLHHQLLFPSDNRGNENKQHYGSLFINFILQLKHKGKAAADSLWFVCIFEKRALCLLGIMFLNVPFSVLSESYSLHSYTSQYFPIAIETACEESTAK